MENTAETVKARAFSADTIKYIAIAAMVLNHLANVFLEEGTMLCECMKAVGYFTAPAMIYFLVEGYYHTRSRKKYFQRLLIFGAVSEVPFCLAFTENGVIAFAGLDMILTLALCYLMIRVYQNVRNRSLQMLLYLIILVASYWCDWALWAPVLTLAFVYTRSSEKKLKETWLLAAMFFGAENYFGSAGSMSASAAAVSSVLGMTAFGMAGVCILHLYNGKRSENHRKFNKWFFYVFYPVHLTVIGVLRIALMH